ncbi:hypothetical protein [Parvibacter caecicola]|uniref:hypothetical protein n=1 Tax=Parvibacter caecicola TaxID=747645 RepID=UPI00248C0013|nr:hypothetical protein [Parvibacter caecicola]
MAEEMGFAAAHDGAEAQQQELGRLALKSFTEGGISPEEAQAVLNAPEPPRTWTPPTAQDGFDYCPDELEDRMINPGSGVGAYAALLQPTEAAPLPPHEAIPALFAKMKPYRQFLATILETCREGSETPTVDAALEPCYEFCSCVYSPIALRKMLVNAGALVNVLEWEDEAAAPEEPQLETAPDEDDFLEDADEFLEEELQQLEQEAAEAAEEEELLSGSVYDQEGYLVIEDEAEGAWLTTDEGLAYLDSIDPRKEFRAAVAQHPEIDDAFYDIIAYCAEEPHNITAIVQHYADDPRFGPSTYYPSYVVDRLEQIGALAWRKNWTPTEMGLEILAERQAQ